MDEKRNEFDEFSFSAITALGHLMSCKEVCKNQRAVMKINRFRAWLMDLKPEQPWSDMFDSSTPAAEQPMAE